MIGRSLGSFHVVAKLGEGGMGEVYRARDTKLGRDVALKVIPDLFASDPERLARFEREAQVLASLNHPNIAHIYGVEESGSVKALVMELVEGKSLDELISGPRLQASGPRVAPASASAALGPGALGLGPDQALSIARQIAEALEVAHEQGIVHRDLKPANVKVRDDGTVKVLDFGLAKAMTGEAAADASNSPTLTARSTQLGVILGTAAYMSPEQARGKAIDRRADIWAFGCVLYEMLTGRRTFEGEEISDTLAAVLRQDVDWSALPATTPPAISRLLRRCLERDPKRRLRDIGEARFLLESGDELKSGPIPAPGVPAPVARTGHRFGVMQLGAVALLAVLATAAVMLMTGRKPSSDTPVRMSVVLSGDLSLPLGTWPAVAISPDGATAVFAARTTGANSLYVRPINEFEPRVLAGTEGAVAPFFSPDGQWIGFFDATRLKKVPTQGGPVVDLATVSDHRGGAWLTNDTIVFSPEPTTPLMQIPAAGGTPKPVAPLDEQKHERSHRWPSPLPDGKTVLMTVGSIEHPDDYDEASIEAVRIDTGARTFLIQGRMARYLPTGHLVFARGKLLYAVAFDPQQLRISGTPVPVVDGVSGDATTGVAHYAVSTNGTLMYVPGDPSGAMRVPAWVDRKGVVTPVDVPPALYCDPKVHPDGKRMAVSVISNSSTRDIVVLDTARGSSSKLTFGGINRTPVWSHDGKMLYYVTYDPSKNLSAIMARAEQGTPERLVDVPGQAYLEDMTTDDTTLTLNLLGLPAGSRSGGAAQPVIKRLSLKTREVTMDPGGVMINATLATVSPDRRWVAYVTSESGRTQVYVESFASGARVAQISTSDGTEPRWSPDGRALFYYQEPGRLMSVAIDPAQSAFTAGRPQMLLADFTYWPFDSGVTYDVTRDKFLVFRHASERSRAPELRVIFNWFTDVTRQVTPGR